MDDHVKTIFETRFSEKEASRESSFQHVWSVDLNNVFADVARYYDKANYVASLGLWGWFRDKFISIIELKPGYKALDVCAGTNAIGIALLEKEPAITVSAMDRSEAMQQVGASRAKNKGLTIDSTIGDVHNLPFPDNHFDIVTLQFASRHLKVVDVFLEIKRVLKPGGHFYHCDMLRPSNTIIKNLHYAYLKLCLTFTAVIFSSSEGALNCRKYFVDALNMFYSPPELSELLRDLGFEDIAEHAILTGVIGYHKAAKPV